METDIQFRRIQSIELVSSKSQHDFPMHSHRIFCLGIITQGKLNFVLPCENYLLNQYDVYLVPANSAHTIRSINNQPYQHVAICIEQDRLIHTPAIAVLEDKTIGKTLFRLVGNAHMTGNDEELLSGINALLAERNKTDLEAADDNIVQEVCTYIRTHLDDPFSLDRLSSALAISKYHLVRMVKAHCGLAPHQLYVQEKIRAVKEGILQEESITSLAHQYHFSDQSHLCHVFKKYLGLSPMAYYTIRQK